MASVSKAVDDIDEAINCMNSVINDLLPNLAVLDDNEESAASMITFLKKRVAELEVLKTDITKNYNAAESKRSELGL